MFCIYCGKPTEGDNDTCPSCAAARSQAAPVAPAAPAPDYGKTTVPDPSMLPPQVQQPQYQPQGQPYGYQQPQYQPQSQQYGYQQPQYQPQGQQYGYQQPQYQSQGQGYQQPQYQPQGQQYGYQQPQYQPYQGETFTLNTPKKPRKKSKRSPIAAIAALGVVAALALVVILCWGSLQGFFLRTFGAPKNYLLHVEEVAIDEAIDSLTGVYGTVYDNLDTTSESAQAELRLKLGDDLISVLEMAASQSGMDMDMDFLKDIVLTMDTTATDAQAFMGLGVGLGSQKILTLNAFLRYADSSMWLGVPELSKTYAFMDLQDLTGTDMSQIMTQGTGMLKELQGHLPEEEKLNELLKKYYRIALEQVNDVTKGSELVQAGNLAQEVTVLTAKIYEKDLAQMALTLANTLNADLEAKTILAELLKAVYTLSPQYTYDWNTGDYIVLDGTTDTAKMVDEWIAETLENMQYTLENSDVENYITVTAYVSKSGDLLGHKFGISGDTETISYLELLEKDAFAFQADLPETQITGNGTLKGDLRSGDYVLNVDGEEVLTLQLSDWNESKAEDGYASGTIRLIPGQMIMDEIMYELDSSVSYLLGSKDLALKLTLNTAEKNSTVAVDLEMDNEVFLGMTLSAASTKANGITFPTDIVDINDDTASMNWITSMDFEKVLSNMRSAGVPAELVDALEEVVGMVAMYAN